MAVDANILIFERMKEELRQGKPKATAIELGFQEHGRQLEIQIFRHLLQVLFYMDLEQEWLRDLHWFWQSEF